MHNLLSSYRYAVYRYAHAYNYTVVSTGESTTRKHHPCLLAVEAYHDWIFIELERNIKYGKNFASKEAMVEVICL